MIENVKIKIEEEEWAEAEPEVRERIVELMKEYGYDIKALEVLQRDLEGPSDEDIYRQFYGDEE